MTSQPVKPSPNQQPVSVGKQAKPYPPRYRWARRLLIAFICVTVAMFIVHHLRFRYWYGKLLEERRLTVEAAGQIGGRDYSTPSVPDEENLVHFLIAASELSPRAFGLSYESYLEVDQDASKQRKLLADNAEYLSLVHRAANATKVDWSEIDTPEKWLNFSTGIVVASVVITNCQIQLQEHTAAFRHAYDLFRIRRRIASAEQSLPGADALSPGLRSTVWRVLQDVLPEVQITSTPDATSGEISRQEAEEFLAMLADESYVAPEFSRNLFAFSVAVQIPEQDQLFNYEHAFLNRTSGAYPWVRRAYVFYVKPTLAKAFCENLRGRRIAADIFQRTDLTMRAREEKLINRLMPVSETFVDPNPTFISAGSLFSPPATPYMSVYWSACHVANLRRLLATALAIKLFEADNGHLPPTLDSLVPDYFVQLPRDPDTQTGEAIAYDPVGESERIRLSPSGHFYELLKSLGKAPASEGDVSVGNFRYYIETEPLPRVYWRSSEEDDESSEDSTIRWYAPRLWRAKSPSDEFFLRSPEAVKLPLDKLAEVMEQPIKDSGILNFDMIDLWGK